MRRKPPERETNVVTSQSANPAADREIVVSRVVDAPRDLVFKVWTSPEHIREWWGPDGFSTTINSIDIRPGGVWDFVMHGPDGTDYVNKITFREVIEPERLVYDHSGESEDDPSRFRSTVTFEEHDGKTLLTMRALFESAALRERVVREFGAVEGGKQTLARLAAHLEDMVLTTGDELVISRTFDAPRELVFKCWTEPEHFMKWWGPHDFDTPFCNMDPRPGGAILFNMRSVEHHMDVWGGGIFQVVEPPVRIVYTDYFADAQGNKVSPSAYGMSDAFPDEAVVSVDFVEHGGKTTMIVRLAMSASVPEREGASMGWSQSFEKLATYLATQG
jgi:uncharacterized protein YndB with AHSA1/START domain